MLFDSVVVLIAVINADLCGFSRFIDTGCAGRSYSFVPIAFIIQSTVSIQSKWELVFLEVYNLLRIVRKWSNPSARRWTFKNHCVNWWGLTNGTLLTDSLIVSFFIWRTVGWGRCTAQEEKMHPPSRVGVLERYHSHTRGDGKDLDCHSAQAIALSLTR